jgi:hypothetical protein
VSADGTIVVGLSLRPHFSSPGSLAIVTRRPGGSWSAPVRVPQSKATDGQMLVLRDRARRSTTVVFQHFRGSGHAYGIRRLVRRRGRWSAAHRMTGRGFDGPIGIALTPAGRAVVAYHHSPAR